MKIDRTSITPIGSIPAANRLKHIEKQTTASESDKIAVSDKAQIFQSLMQKAKELPSVREERVKALADQIERGEFKVDGQKIAEKLFSSDF